MPRKHPTFTNLYLGESLQRLFVLKTLHIAMPIGKCIMLMENDVPEAMGRTNEKENRSKISISAENKDEADKLFKALSAGDQIEFAIAESPMSFSYCLYSSPIVG